MNRADKFLVAPAILGVVFILSWLGLSIYLRIQVDHLLPKVKAAKNEIREIRVLVCEARKINRKMLQRFSAGTPGKETGPYAGVGEEDPCPEFNADAPEVMK